VQCSCHLDVLFDWDDVHNEDFSFIFFALSILFCMTRLFVVSF